MAATESPTVAATVGHVWAQTGPVLPPMTGCGVVGPALPLGVDARPARDRRPITCPDCAHLAACAVEDCERCQRLAMARATAALTAYTERCRLRRGSYARTVEVELFLPDPPADIDDGTAGTEPAGPSNPEPVDVAGRRAWRFHLVDGFPPNRVAKPLRKALWAARPELRGTFTLAIGGDGTRSINIVPDGADPPPQVWDIVHDIAREELGHALADTVPAAGRHVESVPF